MTILSMDQDILFDENYPPNNTNYSSEEQTRSNSSEESKDTDEGSLDALMRDYDGLSATPPRTRIHRRQMKRKDISVCRIISTSSRRRSPAVDGNHMDSEEDGSEPRRKSDKRSIHLLRNSERNLKLNVQDVSETKEESTVSSRPHYKVESASRFWSLNCKLVKTAKNWYSSSHEAEKSRSEFHDYLENLIKAGNVEGGDSKTYKKQASYEQFWQTELKDLIWLELQAYRADRTVTQQDKYLCEARQSVPQLLDDILNYRFEPKLNKLSAQSSDSGVDFAPQENGDICSGCLCLFCPSCTEREELAIEEVGGLLSRLEAAEKLFPSNKCFGTLFPYYQSKEFTGRVEAMCLWYNMMKQHRLKTMIIGKQICSYAKGSDVNSIINSSLGTPDSTDFVHSSYSSTCSIEPMQRIGKFFLKTEYGDTRFYRMFIEDVLKTKGLKKSFQFLENLHLKLLRKGRIALEKPDENNKSYYTAEEHQLRKYGCWSEEYLSLNLPSFRPAFLFMSKLPLDVIHEFLRMRLETRLEKPSSLSIRQLMKELKEALKIAVINKERYLYHCEVALVDYDEETQEKFKSHVKIFDKTAQEIHQLYLSYLEQWVSITQFGKLQKNILEEEWRFITSTAPHFPDCEINSVRVFCKISCSVLQIICSNIKETINSLLSEYIDENETENLPPSVVPTCLASVPHRKMLQLCRGLQTFFHETRDRTVHIVTLMKTLVKYCEGENMEKKLNFSSSCPLVDLRNEAMELSKIMKEEISVIQGTLSKISFDDNENSAIQTRFREVVHQMYRYSFEYYKEVGRIVVFECRFIHDMFELAQNWLIFVKQFCEKGRGVRPRWANFGVEFLLYISAPKFTKKLSDKDFEVFRSTISDGIEYIKGCAEVSTHNSKNLPASPSTGYYYRHSVSNADSGLGSISDKVDGNSVESDGKYDMTREERMMDAIKKLDDKLKSKLQEKELIGTVISTSCSNGYDKNFIKPRTVTFAWQRGIKIGQGRFGKVYTAVNNETGELMAMKEISLSPNDVRTIKSVATELKIFEGIQNENLVRYYGAEIHRDELLIFMELCPEGTLEGLVMASENGLPESLVRRYTKQLINAVHTLHENSIVHRDIKPANIFLTAEGNTLKLGDFGSAVKIRAHTTAPGELKGFVGTQAYMAPEVFMKTNTVGHGRAADIWSLGCVVIEMSSGKRPWAEYDSNYQIMFKVGMGETPTIPESLSEEGKNFINKCIQHKPKNRATIKNLQQDNFLKVYLEDEGLLCTMPSVLEEYLKLGIKR